MAIHRFYGQNVTKLETKVVWYGKYRLKFCSHRKKELSQGPAGAYSEH